MNEVTSVIANSGYSEPIFKVPWEIEVRVMYTKKLRSTAWFIGPPWGPLQSHLVFKQSVPVQHLPLRYFINNVFFCYQDNFFNRSFYTSCLGEKQRAWRRYCNKCQWKSLCCRKILTIWKLAGTVCSQCSSCNQLNLLKKYEFRSIFL